MTRAATRVSLKRKKSKLSGPVHPKCAEDTSMSLLSKAACEQKDRSFFICFTVSKEIMFRKRVEI